MFNDNWCLSLSATMHELGHNLNLGHSGENGDEYDDEVGMMGYSGPAPDGPLKCFNPASSWKLGWYQNQQKFINPLAEGVFTTKLIGVASYNPNNIQPNTYVIVRIQNGEMDLYIGYNHAVGINAGTSERKNQVVIVGTNDHGYDTTTHIWALASNGAPFEIANYQGTNRKLNIRVRSIANSEAILDVYFDNCNPQSNNLIGDCAPQPNLINSCNYETHAELSVELILDVYPEDTSWFVRDPSNNILMQGGMTPGGSAGGYAGNAFRRYNKFTDGSSF